MDFTPPLRAHPAWDTADGRIAATLPVNGDCNLAFHPDHESLAIAEEGEICRWSWRERGPRWRTRKDASVSALGGLAWSSDGALLAAVLAPARAGLLDAATGEVRARFQSPGGAAIRGLALSPGAATLAMARADGSVVLWHLSATRLALSRAGLDWSAPPTPPFAPPGPLRVVVE